MTSLFFSHMKQYRDFVCRSYQWHFWYNGEENHPTHWFCMLSQSFSLTHQTCWIPIFLHGVQNNRLLFLCSGKGRAIFVLPSNHRAFENLCSILPCLRSHSRQMLHYLGKHYQSKLRTIDVLTNQIEHNLTCVLTSAATDIRQNSRKLVYICYIVSIHLPFDSCSSRTSFNVRKERHTESGNCTTGERVQICMTDDSTSGKTWDEHTIPSPCRVFSQHGARKWEDRSLLWLDRYSQLRILT